MIFLKWFSFSVCIFALITSAIKTIYSKNQNEIVGGLLAFIVNLIVSYYIFLS